MSLDATHTLLQLLGQAFDRRAWHGPNLTTALKSVPIEAAVWRPSPARHTIWELMVHAAYWKYRVWRHVSGQKQRFGVPGSNFVVRPEPASDRKQWAAQWSQDRRLLDEWHASLLAAVAAFDADRLREPATQNMTFEGLITGAAAHDLYHAGQVRLLHRLWEGSAA